MATRLEVRELGVEKEGRRILSRVSFTLEAGEYLSVVGPNGSGKSTLLRCVAGIWPPTEGALFFSGQPIQKISVLERARVLSYVPQGFDQLPPYTVEEFLKMSRYPHRFEGSRERGREIIREVASLASLEEFLPRALIELSGGERQMVLIAAAFAQEPKVLVLDEPLTFLDPHHRALVRRLIARLREARPAVSIIEATHDLSSGFENSTGVLALREGERFFFGAPKDFFRKEILEELYRTPVELIERVGSAVPLVIW